MTKSTRAQSKGLLRNLEERELDYGPCACGSSDWIDDHHIICCGNTKCAYDQPVIGAHHWDAVMDALRAQLPPEPEGESDPIWEMQKEDAYAKFEEWFGNPVPPQVISDDVAKPDGEGLTLQFMEKWCDLEEHGFEMDDTCNWCFGNGMEGGEYPAPSCESCNGTGYVKSSVVLVSDLLSLFQSAPVDGEGLRESALALYEAGRWELVGGTGDQYKLWENLRDTLGLPEGYATKKGIHPAQSESDPTDQRIEDASSTEKEGGDWDWYNREVNEYSDPAEYHPATMMVIDVNKAKSLIRMALVAVRHTIPTPQWIYVPSVVRNHLFNALRQITPPKTDLLYASTQLEQAINLLDRSFPPAQPESSTEKGIRYEDLPSSPYRNLQKR